MRRAPWQRLYLGRDTRQRACPSSVAAPDRACTMRAAAFTSGCGSSSRLPAVSHTAKGALPGRTAAGHSCPFLVMNQGRASGGLS
jgi:hypothetical protein